MADYDPLMYAPHAPGAPPPPINEQVAAEQLALAEAAAEQPLFIGPQNLVGPRLPPIDDIVANDPEIRRICSELATLSNKLIGNYKENIVNIASGQLNAYHEPPFNQQQYKQPPLILEGWGNVTENTLIQQIKYYVRMATNPDPNRRRSFNFQPAIDALQSTIRDNLNTKYTLTSNNYIYGFTINEEIFKMIELYYQNKNNFNTTYKSIIENNILIFNSLNYGYVNTPLYYTS